MKRILSCFLMISFVLSTLMAEEIKIEVKETKVEEPKVVGKASQESIKIARRKDLTNYGVAALAVGGAILGLLLLSMHGKHAHHSH